MKGFSLGGRLKYIQPMWKFAASLGLILAMQSALAEDIFLRIASSPIRAELAITPQQREQGLMHRTHLCGNCGMLFVFSKAARYSFWMKDTPIPVSIAFIAPDGRIINIADMQPDTTDIHGAEDNALYALEMNRGWFGQHHIRPGDIIKGLQSVPAAKQ
jgi:uncharacterized protein